MTSLPLSAALPHETTAFRRAAAILVVLTLIRLIALRLSNVDLFFDESQYWSWSRHLAFGYFSKPPLLAWLIAAAEPVCGSAEACVRAPAPLLYLGASLIAYAIGRFLYDARTGFWAAMLTAFGTGTVFSARIISTDVPLTFFSALALLAYVRLLQRADRLWGVVLGAAVGAGLLAKYAMAYFLAGMLLAAVMQKDARMLLRKPALWLAMGVALAVISPNLLWNVENGFLTLRHAANPVLGETIAPSLARPLEFLAAQFAVFGPVVFSVAIAATVFIAFPRLRDADRLLLAFAIPPLAIVTVTAVMVHAYANWAAASFIPLAVLAAALLVRRNSKLLLWASVVIGLLAQVALIGTDSFAPYVHNPLQSSQNPYYATLGWKAYARTAGELARKFSIQTIASDERSDVASLLYYWRDQPEQILAWPTADLASFASTHALTPDAPQPILFVTTCPVVERIAKFYATVTPLGVFVPHDPIARAFHAFRLEDPRGPIGPLESCTPS
jgi:4-amino-4-deoxy-L-arabinose transferase-like glycosyltransferase